MPEEKTADPGQAHPNQPAAGGAKSNEASDWLDITLPGPAVVKLKLKDESERDIECTGLRVLWQSAKPAPEGEKKVQRRNSQPAQSALQDEKSTSEQKQVEDDKKPKGTENMLENVMTKLKAYKGIVITAFIAISLGFLLRRKFRTAGH